MWYYNNNKKSNVCIKLIKFNTKTKTLLPSLFKSCQKVELNIFVLANSIKIVKVVTKLEILEGVAQAHTR